MTSLRTLQKSDLEFLHRWRNDPEVTKDLASQTTTLDRLYRWFDDLGETHVAYAVVVDDVPIGYAEISDIDTANKKCEVGIVIGERRLWSRGIGTTVAKAITEIAFTELGMHRVLAVASERNPASVRCFRRAGFVEEGRLRHANLRDGDFIDLVLLSALEPEWTYGGVKPDDDQVYILTS